MDPLFFLRFSFQPDPVLRKSIEKYGAGTTTNLDNTNTRVLSLAGGRTNSVKGSGTEEKTKRFGIRIRKQHVFSLTDSVSTKTD